MDPEQHGLQIPCPQGCSSISPPVPRRSISTPQRAHCGLDLEMGAMSFFSSAFLVLSFMICLFTSFSQSSLTSVISVGETNAILSTGEVHEGAGQ